jgi:GntR family transcriptional regulator / MocR family aminotransferase
MSPRQLQARDLLVQLDRSRRAELGRQLEQQLRGAIRSGTLAPGCDMPSTRALAEDLGISRGVVVRAYAQLAAEGYLDLRQGANPRVRGIPFPEPPVPRASSPAPVQKMRYDLRPHQPDLSGFPREIWLRSLRHALTRAANADLGYIDPRGLEHLRVELARYLGRARGVLADPDRILVTAGTTHTLSLIARVLALRGTAMGFENPSHRIFFRVAEHAGLTPVGIPVDGDGIRVDAIRAAHVDAVLVTPAHQFPTGVALAADRRAELTLWARESGGLIVEDDYDAELRYDRAPIGPLQGLVPDRVAYIGSANKTLSPGIRLGWAILPDELGAFVFEELHMSVLHLSGIDQLALADFLQRGEFDRHIRRMRLLYKRRRDALIEALEEQLPELRVSGIAAGLHVVVDLPPSVTEADVCAQAAARGLAIESLSDHTLPVYEGPAGLLIGYAGVLEPAMKFAVAELAAAFRAAERATVRRAAS